MMNLNTKLFLLAVLPLLGLLYISAIKLYEGYDFNQNLKKTNTLVDFNEKITLLLHEIQKERGLSAGYLGSEGERFETKLQEQKTITDTEIDKFKEVIGTLNYSDYNQILKDEVNKILELLQGLGHERLEIQDMHSDLQDSINFYSNINNHLLSITDLIFKQSHENKIAKQLFAYSSLLKAKERSGVERAVLSATFGADIFELKMFVKFIKLVAEQDIYIENFLNTTPENMKKYYLLKSNSRIFEDVETLRNVAIENTNIGNFGIDPEYCFDVFSKKIDLLKEVEQKVLNNIKIEIKAYSSDAFYVAIGSGIVIIVILILFFSAISSMPEAKFQIDYLKSKMRRRFRQM